MSDSVAQPARDPAASAGPVPEPAEMSRRFGLRSVRLWFGLALSAASVYLVVRGITWAEVSGTLLHVRWWPVLLAWLVVIVTLASKAERWRLLFWPQHRRVGWWRLFGIMLAGQLINFAFPGRVGDLGRIYFVGQGSGVRRAVAATSIAVEKAVDLIMTLALLALLLPVMAVPGWLRDSALGLTVVTLLLLLALACLTWWGGGALPWLSLPLRILPERVQRPLADQLALALTGLRALRQARILAGVIFWSVVVWVTSVLTNYLVFMGLDLALGWKAALFLLLVLMLGTAIPSSPGKIGVFHYLTVLGLVPFAVEKPVALGVSLILYVIAYSPAVVVGSAFLLRQR